jgi:hypothetical protein
LIFIFPDLAFFRAFAFAEKGETSIVPSLHGGRASTPKEMSRLFPHKTKARKKTRS